MPAGNRPREPELTTMEFQIKRTSRRCRVSGRELLPGEEYVSELVALPAGAPGDFERHDYSTDQWNGPSPGSVGWWRCRIPEMNTGKVYWAPAEVQREYFHQLLAEPRNEARAFVMAMLLVRRKMLRLEQEETDEEGNPWLVVSDPDKNSIRVRVVQLSMDERLVIQQEFADQLFTDQPTG